VYDKVIKKLSFLTKKLEGLEYFIAGGCIRDICNDEEYRDIDIYFKNKSDGHKVRERLFNLGYKWNINNVYICVMEIDKTEVQLIFGRPILNLCLFEEEFDFSVCCCAMDNKFNFVCNENFFDDVKNKTLSVVNVKSAFGTFSRVIRFCKRGYSISDIELLKIFTIINETDKKEMNQDCYDIWSGEFKND